MSSTHFTLSVTFFAFLASKWAAALLFLLVCTTIQELKFNRHCFEPSTIFRMGKVGGVEPFKACRTSWESLSTATLFLKHSSVYIDLVHTSRRRGPMLGLRSIGLVWRHELHPHIFGLPMQWFSPVCKFPHVELSFYCSKTPSHDSKPFLILLSRCLH